MKLSELLKNLPVVEGTDDPDVDLVLESDGAQYQDRLGAVVVAKQYVKNQPTGKMVIKLVGSQFKWGPDEDV